MEGPLLGCLPGFPSSLWRHEICWGTQDPPGESSPPKGSGSKVSFSEDICSPPSLTSQAVPSFPFLPQVWLPVGLGEMGRLTPAQVSTDRQCFCGCTDTWNFFLPPGTVPTAPRMSGHQLAF